MADVNGGTSKAAAATRRLLFAERYLTNGRNASEAAIHIGVSPQNAGVQGYRYLQHPVVKEIIAARTVAVVEQAILSTDRWAKEMAAIGHFDPKDMYDEEGVLIPIHKLPEHVRRAISSVKHEQRRVGKGEDSEYANTTEVKLWDKNTALTNIGRHLGVFDKDNVQRITAIQVNVNVRG